MKRSSAILVFLIITITIAITDLWSKDAAFRLLEALIVDGRDGLPIVIARPPIEIIPGKLALEAAVNRGAFNGWFAGMRWLLIGVSLAWVVGSFLWVIVRPGAPLLVTAISLTAGGALGNLYDRFQFGVVRDFVKVYHKSLVWPNFNVADSAICVGVGLIILREILVARQARRETAAVDDEAPKEIEEGAGETP